MNRFKKRLIKCKEDESLYPQDEEVFDSTFRSSLDRYSFIAEHTSSRLGEGKRILDAGCGIGLFLRCMQLLGHNCTALDFVSTYREKYEKLFAEIPFHECNLEISELPFDDETFDVVVCSQVLEHFTYSHLPAVIEMRRILKKGGLLFVDVPNVACFRNRIRMLRGKNITWDYERHYLKATPIRSGNDCFFPDRHNREFTLKELELLFRKAGFDDVSGYFIKSRRYRQGIERTLSLGTALKDFFPSLRKTVLAIGKK
jgi:ubiquinone/menaquinone biosynthesis C-methylase UbiE